MKVPFLSQLKRDDQKMKKLITLLIVFLFAITTLYPVQSSASKLPFFSSEAEQHVVEGELNAAELNKQISIAHTKTIKLPSTIYLAFLKKAITEAKKDLPKVKNSKERAKLQVRLKALETTQTRVQYYLDGMIAGKKLADATARFKKLYSQYPLDDITEKAYQTLSSEITNQGKVLNKIYGNPTRAAFLKKYKAPAEALIKEKASVIAVKKSLDKLGALIDSDSSDETIQNQIKLIEKQLVSVKDATVKKNVSTILNEIKETSSIFKLYLNMHKNFNEENLEGILDTYPQESEFIEELKAYLTPFFETYDVQIELQDFEVEELTKDKAVVKIVQVNTKTDESDYRNNVTKTREVLIKVDGKWMFSGESEILSVDFNE